MKTSQEMTVEEKVQDATGFAMSCAIRLTPFTFLTSSFAAVNGFIAGTVGTPFERALELDGTSSDGMGHFMAFIFSSIITMNLIDKALNAEKLKNAWEYTKTGVTNHPAYKAANDDFDRINMNSQRAVHGEPIKNTLYSCAVALSFLSIPISGIAAGYAGSHIFDVDDAQIEMIDEDFEVPDKAHGIEI